MKISRKPVLMNAALTLALKENTYVLLKELSRFDYPSFNSKPDPHAWSAGEIAEHLLIFDLRLSSILSTEPSYMERDPQERIEQIADRLADRVNRLEAPAPLLPSGTAKDPEALYEKLSLSRNQLLQKCEESDLTLFFTATPHPILGVLSGVEWINFLIHHTNRHLQQLAAL